MSLYLTNIKERIVNWDPTAAAIQLEKHYVKAYQNASDQKVSANLILNELRGVCTEYLTLNDVDATYNKLKATLVAFTDIAKKYCASLCVIATMLVGFGTFFTKQWGNDTYKNS